MTKLFDPEDKDQVIRVGKYMCDIGVHDGICYEWLLGSFELVCYRCGHQYYKECLSQENP